MVLKLALKVLSICTTIETINFKTKFVSERERLVYNAKLCNTDYGI